MLGIIAHVFRQLVTGNRHTLYPLAYERVGVMIYVSYKESLLSRRACTYIHTVSTSIQIYIDGGVACVANIVVANRQAGEIASKICRALLARRFIQMYARDAESTLTAPGAFVRGDDDPDSSAGLLLNPTILPPTRTCHVNKMMASVSYLTGVINRTSAHTDKTTNHQLLVPS